MYNSCERSSLPYQLTCPKDETTDFLAWSISWCERDQRCDSAKSTVQETATHSVRRELDRPMKVVTPKRYQQIKTFSFRYAHTTVSRRQTIPTSDLSAADSTAKLQLHANRTCSNAEQFLRPCEFPWWAATTRRTDRPRSIRSESLHIFVELRPNTNRPAPQPHQEQPLVDKVQYRERGVGASASNAMVARHAKSTGLGWLRQPHLKRSKKVCNGFPASRRSC